MDYTFLAVMVAAIITMFCGAWIGQKIREGEYGEYDRFTDMDKKIIKEHREELERAVAADMQAREGIEKRIREESSEQ